MAKFFPAFFTTISIAGDLCILNLLLFQFFVSSSINNFNTYWIGMFIQMNLVWIVLALSLRLSALPRIKQRKKIIRDILLACMIWFFLLLIENLLFHKEVIFSAAFGHLLLYTFLSLLVWKLILDSLAHLFHKYGFNTRNVLIVGYNSKAEELRDYFINNLWSGYQFKGYIDDKQAADVVGNFQNLAQIVTLNNIKELFLNISEIPQQFQSSIMETAYELHLSIKLIPDFGDYPAFFHSYQRYDILPIIDIRKGAISESGQHLLKKLFDLVFSLLIIGFLLSWLTPVCALLIKMSSRGPVFFKQKRTGYRNKTFTCLKFRTMVRNEDADILQASENDIRVTSIGKFLRRTSIDELPQFFNVLAGQMSIVGPRPHMLQHTEKYSSQIPQYYHRHYFRPGITGLAQVRGFRGQTKELDLMKARIKFDIYYIENWSLWLDLKIIFLTILHLFKGEKNVY
jgi:putative colanic acid biosysnthesis UDP-glucose lipid carrier transferase